MGQIDDAWNDIPELLRPIIESPIPNESGELKGRCPFHDDENPSASFNLEKGVYNCFKEMGCGGGRVKNVIRHMQEMREINEQYDKEGGAGDNVIDFTSRRRERGRNDSSPTDKSKLPKMAEVVGWHEHLMSTPERLQKMMDRGLTPETCQRYLLGYDTVRRAYTIPVIHGDTLHNVKFYKPGSGTRYFSVTGHGRSRLYPEVTEAQKVVLAEGEYDALIVRQNMEELGFSATSTTGGAVNGWRPEFAQFFEDKDVYICYDADHTGVRGGRRVAGYLDGIARTIRIVDLPYEIVEKHGADITDLFVKDGYNAADFHEVLEDAPYFGARQDKEPEEEQIQNVTLQESFNAGLVGSRVGLTCTITGKRNPPFKIAAEIDYSCNMDAGNKCLTCPMLIANGDAHRTIEPNDSEILDMIEAPAGQREEMYRKRIGAPKCGRLSMDVTAWQNVEELFARPRIDLVTEAESEYINRKILSVGSYATQVNRTVQVEGTPLSSPKNARSELLAWEVQPTETSIERFRMTPELAEGLKVFCPAADQTPLQKAGDIARELSQNVTFIYEREAMHIAMDLVWHSALSFRFDNKLVPKGWLELLVLGDTRTGKSEAAERLSRHYRAGRIVSCESATYAGVVGGLQQIGGGKEWSITWGAIPLNDRRLVVLDEISGMTTDQISQMSSIRSSGVAQLTKIQSEETTSRTRLIWMGNPRNGKLSDYTYGIYAVQPLIGNQEDIARFDFAMTVAADEVSSEAINRSHGYATENYPAELCSALVHWVWSRKAEDVTWAQGAVQEVYDAAGDLGGRYVEDPPLVQSANVRVKVARMAVALAARTFSTDETAEKIVVQPEHVRDVVKFLDYLYSRPSFGYQEHSKELIEDAKEAAEQRERIITFIRDHQDLAKFLRGQPYGFRRSDMEDMLSYSREEASAIINELYGARMVVKKPGGEIRLLPVLQGVLRTVR